VIRGNVKVDKQITVTKLAVKSYFPLKGLERLAPIFNKEVNGISMMNKLWLLMMCMQALVTLMCPNDNIQMQYLTHQIHHW
jgi:hypothetical protein